MGDPPDGTVTVTGQASVTVQPKAAAVTVGVECRAANPAAALADCAARVDVVLAATESLGVPERAVRTGLLSVRPDEDPPGVPPAAFLAGTVLEVRGVAVAEVGALLQAVLDAAGDAARVHGVGLTADVDDETRRALRAAAFADARSAAEQLAALADASLGEVVWLRDSDVGGGLPRRLAAMAAAAPTAVQAGETELAASVVGCWRLVPRDPAV